MRWHNKLFILGALGISFIRPPQPARAQIFGLGGATEWTQLANFAQLISLYAGQARQVANELQQIQMMVREGKALIEHPATNIMGDLMTLGQVVNQSAGLAYTMGNMDQTFRTVYRPYTSTYGGATYHAAYNGWAKTTLDTIRGAMNAAGLQGAQLMTEQATLNRLRSMIQTTTGRNQAIELGNVIAGEQVAQIEKLRQLMISDMDSKAAFTAQQITQQQTEMNSARSAWEPANWQADRRSW